MNGGAWLPGAGYGIVYPGPAAEVTTPPGAGALAAGRVAPGIGGYVVSGG